MPTTYTAEDLAAFDLLQDPVCGIGPELATAIVHAGLECFQSLADALKSVAR